MCSALTGTMFVMHMVRVRVEENNKQSYVGSEDFLPATSKVTIKVMEADQLTQQIVSAKILYIICWIALLRLLVKLMILSLGRLSMDKQTTRL